METKFKVALFFMLIFLSSCRKGDNSNNETAVSVKVQTVGIATDNNSQFYSGTVKEENGVALSFINGGTIEQMAVDEGQYVKKGQLIAISNTSQAYYQWQAAHTQTLQARDYYNRLMQLKATNSVPAVQLVEAQSKLREAKSQESITSKMIRDCSIRAPFDGYISEKTGEIGLNAGPGMSIAKLVKIDHVKINVSVPEQEMSSMKVGKPVKLQVDVLSGRVFIGRISEIGVEADILSHSYPVSISINNPDHKLLPGMICKVYIGVSHNRGIIIPFKSAQMDNNNRYYVWVVNKGVARRKSISICDENENGINVTGGLSTGEELIVEGMQKISDGSRVNIIK